MGKTTLLKMVILVILFLTGNNVMQADTYSHTITAKTWSAYDTQTLTGVSWTASATGGSYWGYDATKGQQFGSSGSPATALSLTTNGISGTVTSIKVSTSGGSSVVGAVSISVGGTAFTPASTTISATNTEYTFTGSSSGQIVISWSQTSSKALYLKALNITYSASNNPTIAASPASLSFSSNLNVTSASQAVTVTGTNLTSAPTYSITGTDAAQFSATGSLTTAGGNLDVTFTPTSVGAKTATLEIKSGTLTKTVALSGTGIDLTNPYNLDDSSPLTSLNETFGDGTAIPTTLPSGWKSVLVQGSKNWEMKLFSSNNYAQMTAYGGSGVCQSLLISPAINFDVIQKNNVKFDWLAGFANGATLKVYVMQKDGTKTEVKAINATKPASGYETAFTTETLDLSAYSGVKFLVFEYNGNTTTPATTTYQIDNVVASKVQATITITETTIPAMSAEVNATDTKTINVGGSGLSENINLNITGADAAMFGVSPATLTLEGNAVPDQFVTITYKPTAAGSHNAILEITSIGVDTKTMALTGSATDVGTGNAKVQQTAKVWVANGKIMVEAAAGEAIEIYNAIGQKLVSRIASESLNEIDLYSKGVHLVKVSNCVARVLL
ncbi:MAG TPA: choice-of-anchor J domain-containing protein [Paludibacteraceae bacterium]|nr:choice-of-anchor J domain-containing protein [Paludibacteraceae bacterium]